ncbi:MAG TPA: hypothetical protein VM051_05460 [Usitatibacter sp.]|nr:hypothetical protein [Usitatibacter sp.]
MVRMKEGRDSFLRDRADGAHANGEEEREQIQTPSTYRPIPENESRPSFATAKTKRAVIFITAL